MTHERSTLLRRGLAGLAVLAGLLGCSTPYQPAVFVEGTPDFQGLVDMLHPTKPLDVVLVHGMCTHTAEWATNSMGKLVDAIRENVRMDIPVQPQAVPSFPTIQVVPGRGEVAGSQLRFTGLVWSSMTAGLKKQLAYDKTAAPTNCAASGVCSPERAKYNGQFKDGLLNDCLADALIYQGDSRDIIRENMAQALTNVLDGIPSDGPLVVITDSLGSKLVFDALTLMLSGRASTGPAAAATAQRASERLGQVFMNANQLPILSLADQSIAQPPSGLEAMAVTPKVEREPMRNYLRMRRQANLSKLIVVAFTDPNDLLSYRLMGSHFTNEYVSFGDVLVSNSPTYFGRIQNPATAHTGYSLNPDVARIITCGPEREHKNPKCK